ncbi:LysR family transcriptional regulator [Granulosicoccus sp. 3-233]|uniref:LysR family transcriptional regulator n=1 Tax=Granulosicoccus sp. 3-233 TaxID=3417969 RepID=UPI003D32D784
MDKWAELRTAYQVARLGTVSAAAEALGFHRATVNRHIDVLEQEMGDRIFIRHSRGYTLTELGEDVLKVAQQAEALIDDLAGRVQGRKAQVEGEVKLAILVPFAGLIMQSIAEFRRLNPHCRVCITATENLAKLEYGEAHVALRAGTRPEHPDYVVREFLRVTFNLYAHDSYVQRYGIPADVHDLAGHAFVTPDLTNSRAPFSNWFDEQVKDEQIAFSSNNFQVCHEAIAAGLGIGVMSDMEAEGRKDMHRVLADEAGWSLTIWQVTHVDLHRTEKVQALLSCIRDHLDVKARPYTL